MILYLHMPDGPSAPEQVVQSNNTFFVDLTAPQYKTKEAKQQAIRELPQTLKGYIEIMDGNIPDEVFDKAVNIAEAYGNKYSERGPGDPRLMNMDTRAHFDRQVRIGEALSADDERNLMRAQLSAFIENPTIIKDPRTQAVLEKIASFKNAFPLSTSQMYTEVASQERTSEGFWRQTRRLKPGITKEEHLPIFQRYLSQVKREGIYPNFPDAFISSAKEAVALMQK